jgi:hypothetical protein
MANDGKIICKNFSLNTYQKRSLVFLARLFYFMEALSFELFVFDHTSVAEISEIYFQPFMQTLTIE